MFHMNYIIEGEGALVNEAGEETALKAGNWPTGHGPQRDEGRIYNYARSKKDTGPVMILFATH